MKSNKEKLQEALKWFQTSIDKKIIQLDGFEDAFIGVSIIDNNYVAVYSTDKILSNLMHNDCMSATQAEEHFINNIENLYCENNAVIFVSNIPRHMWDNSF